MDDKTWNKKTKKSEKTPREMIEFLKEIDAVCKKYNYSISHEDSHGAFIIEKYDEDNIRWLNDAIMNF